MGSALIIAGFPTVLAGIWWVNRTASRRASNKTMAAVFYLSAAMPLVLIAATYLVSGMATGRPDPKLLPLLLTIGLPLSGLTTAIAYRASQGRTGRP